MASPWDGREEAMTSEGEGAGWRVEVGQTHHGRLSLVLCHECQTLHYQLHCRTSSRLAGTVTAGDSPSCRNSVSWEEFFGKGVTARCLLLSPGSLCMTAAAGVSAGVWQTRSGCVQDCA